MAHPITPTPVLEGKDAEIFLSELENSKPNLKKDAYLKECRKVFRIISQNK
ncbi:Uncharacterised protein [uncultured archaeon]|nr:Uncharacterised protein [uncultured archaeon]